MEGSREATREFQVKAAEVLEAGSWRREKEPLRRVGRGCRGKRILWDAWVAEGSLERFWIPVPTFESLTILFLAVASVPPAILRTMGDLLLNNALPLFFFLMLSSLAAC